MKKRLFSSLFLGAICGIVSAQTLKVADVEVLANGKASYALDVDVQGGTYTGVQFNIVFPSGFVVTTNTTALSTWGGANVLSGELNASGAGKVSCYSSSGKAIPDGGVILGTIEFSTTAPVEEYTVNITDVIFMTSDTKVSANNTSFKVKVVNRLTLDENSAIAPIATTDKVNVHVARTINAGSWSTLCLPISLSQAQANEAFGSDAQYGEFDGFSTEYSNDEDVYPDAIVLKFKKLTLGAKSQLGAGKPYLIKTTKDIKGFDADNVQIVNTVTSVDKADEYNTDGSFVGTLAKTKVPADALFISGKKFWYSTGDRETKAFRAWFALGAVLEKETTDFSSRVMIKFIDDDATGIKSVNTTNGENIYTLSGQRVSKAGKGVYIVNGKKVIKK